MELNRFGKRLEECETLLDKWCFALKHIGTLDRLPDELRAEAFERLFNLRSGEREPDVWSTFPGPLIVSRSENQSLN